MGWLGKLVAHLTRDATPPHSGDAPARPASSDLGISFTISGPSSSLPPVSDVEVAERVNRYAFVLAGELPDLSTTDQWWAEAAHKRRIREHSEKAWAWANPFMPVEIARSLASPREWGPSRGDAIAKELRALIRERRKAKQPYEELLKALYGACVMTDFAASLEFEGRQPHAMTCYVDVNDLKDVQIEYLSMGYHCIKSVSKTDVKWLIEAFGEPAEHQSFDCLRPQITRNAITRHCWSEVRSSNKAARSLGMPEKSMKAWLDELVRRNIGYYKEWQQRVASSQARAQEERASIDAALAAMSVPFVVADLETTGLNCSEHEILELGAVLVEPGGRLTAEFSVLVQVSRPVPDNITRLTNIKQVEVDSDGCPLEEAIIAFSAFVGARPVFFHNAPFDAGFLRAAAMKTRQKVPIAVHDTLAISRVAWPKLGTYKLGALSAHVGCPPPTHRALADARAAARVLIAAHARIEGTG